LRALGIPMDPMEEGQASLVQQDQTGGGR
jgi:hypothetical protein